MRLRCVLLSISSIFFLGACNQDQFTVQPQGPVETQVPVKRQASQEIKQSFLPTGPDVCAKASCISLRKTALGKLFLLIASGKTAGSTPQWYDLKPLVVSFEKSGSKLALLAENYTSIYREIKTVNLIQTFNIVTEDEETITFDWDGGLKTFILQGSYDVDAVRGEQQDLTESSFSSIPVVDSFVRGIKFDQKNIELEQISKIRTDGIKGDGKAVRLEIREETLAMNIQIRAYEPGKNFSPKEFDKSRRVGFFVTKISKPGLSRDVLNLVTKWDLSSEKGPIVVRISDAVPADYLQAVTEGVLYWNKVFRKDVLVVKTGVDPQAGPEDRSIMLRWIPWLDSGAAYAIGQSDPLTGEVLRAQVFMPSVFTGVGSGDLVDFNDGAPVVGAVACDLKPALESLAEMSREASDSQRLRLAQDSVRSTVAHEMGHALGLRHNFAGSYSAKVSAFDIREVVKGYFKDPHHQGLETTTSIMDYVSGVDNILSSARLKFAALSYDKMAMEWAYAIDDKALDEKVSLYCTDEDISLAASQQLQVYGCERFDAGNNPLLKKVLDSGDERRNFVRVLFASIVGRRYPADKPQVVNDLQVVLKDTLKWGVLAVTDLKYVSQVLLETKGKDGAPMPAFMSLTNLKSGQILQSKAGVDPALDKIRALALDEIQGYSGVLRSLWLKPDGSLAINWLDQQIEELKQSAYLMSGKTLGGREYQFSNAEQTLIIKFFESLRTPNRKVLSMGLASLLPDGGTSFLPQGLMNEDRSKELADLYLAILNAEDGVQEIKIGEGLKQTTLVSKRFFSAVERNQWARLVSSQGLRFSMELKKATLLGILEAGISQVLWFADPKLVFASIEKPELLPEELLKKGLIDAPGAQWLQAEISVYLALKSQP